MTSVGKAKNGEASKWEVLIASYPYGNPYVNTEGFGDVTNLTGTRLAVLNADWVAATALSGQLYVDMMDLPGDLDSFLADYMTNTRAEDFDQDLVDCAGFQESGVSNNNQVICRHKAGSTVGSATISPRAKGTRISLKTRLVSLKPRMVEKRSAQCGNGQQAYYISDVDGTYLEEAPVDVVFDHNADAAVVQNAISCVRCHSKGVIPKNDEILDAVTDYTIYTEEEEETVRGWFTPNEELTELYQGPR